MEKYLFHVDGIRCSSCVQKLEKLPVYIEGIQSSHVYFGESLLEVQSSKGISPDKITNVIHRLGFNAQFLESKEKQFELHKITNRKFLSKIGVAGFCAGNLMLFSIPIYTGVEGWYKTGFAYLSFLVFLPILLYAGLDFYKNAVSSLKIKSLSIDLPISLALIFGFIFSSYNLLEGHYDYLYFDSTASFIFLILSARYLLMRFQQNFVSTYTNSDFKVQNEIKLHDYNIYKNKNDLKVGEVIWISKGQVLPVDCELQSDFIEWSNAAISGESEPKVYHRGTKVSSGSVLMSEYAVLKVLKTYKDSDITRIQNQLEVLKNTKAPVQDLTDRFSQYFILTVFALAFGFFVYYARTDVFEAFQRSLALLIVACPCAMALGTPLAYLMGAYRAKKNGILIFRKDIFDRVLESKYLFFDKTGTLTYGVPQIVSIQPQDTDLINILLNLEKTSMHPLALALRKKYQSFYSDLKIESTETIGQGVSGVYQGKYYSFEKDPSGRSSSHLLCDGEKVLELTFEDQLRPETRKVVAELKKYFKDQVGILTGDSINGTQHVSKEVALDWILTDHTPEMKFEAIKAHNPSIMVGDGWNDSLALQVAHVGIAVNGSVQSSADHSDAYFLKKGIGQVLTLITVSKNVRRTLKSNLVLSLFYNLIAGFMALTGDITPLLAAILMPISSVVILLNTLRGVK